MARAGPTAALVQTRALVHIASASISRADSRMQGMARRQSDVPPFVDAACGSPAPDVRRGAVHGLAAPRRSQTRGGRAAADYRSLAINLPGGGRGTQLFLLLLFVLAEGGRPKKSWAHGVRRWQLCTILHSRWIFPRDNEWIFSPTGPLLDLGSNSGQCLRA